MTAPTSYTPGPFDSTHVYVQWGGKLPGEEEWSCGFRMWSPAGSTEADNATLLAPVSAAISAFHTSVNANISYAAKLSFVKVNAIDINGRYQGNGTTEATYADLAGGGTISGWGTTGMVYPNQVTLACSLTTGYSRGPAHRGRFYLPLPAIPVDSSGRITAANAANVRTACGALRTAVNANGTDHVMAVMSRKLGAPGHRAVTGFEIGMVLDTQRRRRRSLMENYQ